MGDELNESQSQEAESHAQEDGQHEDEGSMLEAIEQAGHAFAQGEQELMAVVAPAEVAGRGEGARFVFTIEVDDVDGMCAELAARGVTLLNGPMDRPWGVRTASFVDPAGYIWEIAK